MGKFSAKPNKKPNRFRLTVLLLVLLIFGVVGTGTLLARYVARNEMQAEMVAAGFHISSDYLKENGAEYTVSNWRDGITVELYNYEVENVAQIAEKPISYDIEISNDWEVSRGSSNVQEGILSGDGAQKDTHSLLIRYTGSGSPSSVELKVKATSPYAKTLRATFNLSTSSIPDYTLSDQGNHVLLTIHSNDYEGNVTVNWTASLSPDNTSQYMTSWLDASHSGTLTVEPFHTYELIFVENTTKNYSGSGTGTTIQIGN